MTPPLPRNNKPLKNASVALPFRLDPSQVEAEELNSDEPILWHPEELADEVEGVHAMLHHSLMRPRPPHPRSAEAAGLLRVPPTKPRAQQLTSTVRASLRQSQKRKVRTTVNFTKSTNLPIAADELSPSASLPLAVPSKGKERAVRSGTTRPMRRVEPATPPPEPPMTPPNTLSGTMVSETFIPLTSSMKTQTATTAREARVEGETRVNVRTSTLPRSIDEASGAATAPTPPQVPSVIVLPVDWQSTEHGRLNAPRQILRRQIELSADQRKIAGVAKSFVDVAKSLITDVDTHIATLSAKRAMLEETITDLTGRVSSCDDTLKLVDQAYEGLDVLGEHNERDRRP